MNFAARKYLIWRLNWLQRKLDRSTDLCFVWREMNLICGLFFRAGLCLSFDELKHKWRIV